MDAIKEATRDSMYVCCATHHLRSAMQFLKLATEIECLIFGDEDFGAKSMSFPNLREKIDFCTLSLLVSYLGCCTEFLTLCSELVGGVF